MNSDRAHSVRLGEYLYTLTGKTIIAMVDYIAQKTGEPEAM